jgi:hypothetical protein
VAWKDPASKKGYASLVSVPIIKFGKIGVVFILKRKLFDEEGCIWKRQPAMLLLHLRILEKKR